MAEDRKAAEKRLGKGERARQAITDPRRAEQQQDHDQPPRAKQGLVGRALRVVHGSHFRRQYGVGEPRFREVHAGDSLRMGRRLRQRADDGPVSAKRTMDTLTIAPTHPNRPTFKPQYENLIGGKWTPPVDGEYFENRSPIDDSLIAKMPRSKAADVDLAVEAAHKAFETWEDLRHREEQHAPADRRRDRAEPRLPRPRRDRGQRQGRARDDGGGPAALRRPLPLLRGRDPGGGGLA